MECVRSPPVIEAHEQPPGESPFAATVALTLSAIIANAFDSARDDFSTELSAHVAQIEAHTATDPVGISAAQSDRPMCQTMRCMQRAYCGAVAVESLLRRVHELSR